MIKINENGTMIMKSIEEPVSDFKNYLLFTKPNPKLPERILKILKKTETLNGHLSKYLVIYVTFHNESMQSYKDASEKCKKIIDKT